MSTAPYSSDIVLSKTDGSTNKVGLKLYRDRTECAWRMENRSCVTCTSKTG